MPAPTPISAGCRDVPCGEGAFYGSVSENTGIANAGLVTLAGLAPMRT